MLPSVVVLSLLWAIASQPPKGWIRRYLWAQILYIPYVWGTYYIFGETSKTYAFTYAECTAAILVCVVGYSWEHLRDSHTKILTVIAAAGPAGLLCLICFSSLKTVHYYDVIQVLEATVLLACGLIVGMGARWVDNAKLGISITLFLTFISQALFRVGFIIHLPDETWIQLNRWVPAALVIAACAGICLSSLLTRQRHPVLHREL